MKRIILFAVLLGLMACNDNKGDDKLAEKSEIQSKEQIAAKNLNDEKWAQGLEGLLNRRWSFINAVKGGIFEGELDSAENPLQIRLKFTSSISDERTGRVRTVQEIQWELAHLSLHVQVQVWSEDNPLSSVGCIVEGVKPETKRGYLEIMSHKCPWSLAIYFADAGSRSGRPAPNRAQVLAQSVLGGSLVQIGTINGSLSANGNAQTVYFRAER